MGHLEQFAEMEQRLFDKQLPTKQDLYREEWLNGDHAQFGLVREVVGWIGDQLVSWGETLRSWSSPHTPIQAS